MKKILISGIVLFLATFKLPASAIVYDQWGTLQSAFTADFLNAASFPLIMGNNITAPYNGGNLGTTNFYTGGTNFQPSGYTLTGDGVHPTIWVNEDCGLKINGNGIITNTNSVLSIMNNGPLTLNGVTVQTGIQQTDYSNAKLYIGATDGYPSDTVLNGNNNITTGVFTFTPGSTRASLEFNGGTIGSNVNISVDGSMNVFNIGGGNLYLNGAKDTDWEMGGQINMSSGSLTLMDFSHTTLNTADNSGNNCYIQTGGTLNLTSNSHLTLNDGPGSSIKGGQVNINGGSSLNIQNGLNNNEATIATSGSNNALSIGNFNSQATTLTLNSGSDIKAGTTVNIGTSGGTNTGNTINVATGATIESGANVNINQGNKLNVAGGDVTLNNTDNWAGQVNVTSGNLNLDGGTYSDSANPLSQTGGTLNLENGANLTLHNANTITTKGSSTTTVNIGTASGTDGSSLNSAAAIQPANSTSTLLLNIGSATSTGNSLNIVGGTLYSSASVAINANNTLNVSSGAVMLNGTGQGADSWAGTGIVYVSGTGILTLDNFTHEASGSGSYLQTGGTLCLANGSNLTLDSGNSITAGNVGFIGTGSSLGLASGSTLASNAAMNISTGNSLNLTGGTATLNGTGTGADSWKGTVSVGSGTLNLNGITSNGVLTQSGGTINLASDSTLTYGNSSSLSGGTFVDSGTLNLSRTNQNSISSTITGNGIINKNGTGETVFTNNSKDFVGTYNQTAGTTTISATAGSGNGTFLEKAVKNLTGGTLNLAKDSALTLMSTDTWTGTSVSNGGLLTLDGFSHAVSTAVNYNQTSTGNLLLANGSTLKLGTGSSITTGNVGFTGTGNTLDISTGATFNPNFTFDIAANNNFNVSGGSATLDSANTTWNGNVNLSSGNLTLKNITVNGIFNQTGGSVNMDTGSILTLDDGSSLSGGTLVNNGVLNLSNTSLATIATQIGCNSSSTGTSQINKNAAGETVFTADNSGYTGTYNQSAGKATIQNNFFTGANNFTGGTAEIQTNCNLILNSASSWTNTNISNTGGAFTMSGMSHDSTGAGTYNQSSGTTYLYSGANLTLDLDNGSSLSGGRLVDNATLNLKNNADKTVATSLSGNGVINKNGSGTLLLTGQNLTYTGNLWVNAGTVDFNTASGLTDSYISGTTHLNGGNLNLSYDRIGSFGSPVVLSSGSALNLDTNGHTVTSFSNNVSGAGTLNKTGDGAYTVFAGSNGTFDYALNVNGGSMNVVTGSGTAANFNSPVSVSSANLLTSAANTNFNNGLSLDHGYLGVLNGGFNVTNGLTVGSTINTMNGSVATNNISGGLNIGSSGTSEFLIDISPKARTSDKYAINGDITTNNNNGVIKVSDFRIVGAPTLLPSLNIQVFDPTGTIDPAHKGITFTSTDKTITSMLGQYGLSSLGSGDYLLSWKDFNPQAFRGQVATEAAYANQLTTNNIIFDHINLVTQQLLSEDKPNVYANENPLFAPYQYSKQDGTLWYKAYGNIERLQLSQNINTQNNMWGSLIGADFPLVKLKNGWSVLPTTYVGYMGAYQTYSGVDMYQNGGQFGAMGTFFKGNFITSLLANVGGYYNDMSVAGTRDKTGNWFAGVASKSAYNIKLPKDFILQPNVLLSYNAFGAQNWNSDFGGVGMTSSMLNGLNFGPGVNLILNKGTWSVYATTQLMVNAMNGVSGTIEDVDLPTVKMGSTYISYGLGFTKVIKDRLSLYGQVLFSNGVRTGVGFQGGLQWKL